MTVEDINYDDWVGECRIDPSDGNAYVLRGISGEMMDGAWGYSVRVNDIFGGHERYVAAFEWVSWAVAPSA
jgi:hypothetical protein